MSVYVSPCLLSEYDGQHKETEYSCQGSSNISLSDFLLSISNVPTIYSKSSERKNPTKISYPAIRHLCMIDETRVAAKDKSPLVYKMCIRDRTLLDEIQTEVVHLIEFLCLEQFAIIHYLPKVVHALPHKILVRWRYSRPQSAHDKVGIINPHYLILIISYIAVSYTHLITTLAPAKIPRIRPSPERVASAVVEGISAAGRISRRIDSRVSAVSYTHLFFILKRQTVLRTIWRLSYRSVLRNGS